MKKRAKNIQAWKSVSDVWRYLKPPLRPSPGEIKIYERFFKKVLPKNGHRRALLFGSTPELRDLLAKYKFEVTLIDINPAMVKTTTKLVKRKNSQEKIIIGDWLKIKLPQNYYDLVIGDHIIGNINFKKWNFFFSSVMKLLTKNGYFLTNVQLSFPVKKALTFENLIKLYIKNPKRFNDTEYKWQMLYQMMYSDKRFCGNRDYMILWPAIPQIQKMLKLMKVDMKIKRIAQLGDYIYVKEFKYCSPPRAIFEKIFKKYFKIISSDINRRHSVYQSYRIYLAKLLEV
jgi:ubiquinone/menaquinone biosynthesis C-methylase UbiE